MVESVRVGVFFDILEGVGLILSKSAIEKDETDRTKSLKGVLGESGRGL